MTHTIPRVPKTGLRRTDPARLRNTVRLELTGQVPPHPPTADHLNQVREWNGDTNNDFGTCGPCAVANSVILTWLYLLGEVITVSDSAIFDLYRRSGNPTFDPNARPGPDGSVPGDNGVDMTVMLAELVRNGIDITHASGTTERVRPLAFASAPAVIDGVRAITSIFGGALLAVTLQTAQQTQTATGVWDYALSPEWGGHAVEGGAYQSLAGAGQIDETIISWQRPVGTTDQFLDHQLDEVYVVVWQPLWDHPAFQQGVDRAALAADYTASTGRPFPVPAPAPVPPPLPVPDPGTVWVDSADQALWAGLPPDWVTDRHTGKNRIAAGLVAAWWKIKNQGGA